ncbi:hydroxyacid oxidase 1-like [Ixodes scapularis]|uniref:hydroxyacid oxidase 1-like n=1 Tax=Ixodes scapularis TaxID=6945 RepID=UPI001A9DFFDC|nr:hydroxyacid oxidase 1-like [Ixodes scapularis]
MTTAEHAMTDDLVATVDDIERLGCSKLSIAAAGYFNGGADTEQTLRENKMAYHRLRLRPRVLRDVAQRNMEVTLLEDQVVSMPVGISPTAFQNLAHRDGETATARAAQSARTLLMQGLFSCITIEDVKKAAPDGLQWLQLYIFKDRSITRDIVERAERAGYRALVLTVDMPIAGKQIARIKNKFKTPKVANFAGLIPNKAYAYGGFLDPSLTWDDVTWLKSITKLPVIAKGICNAEDAEEAINCGVSAILVSNHGGRQLDGVPATIEVLPEVVTAVRGRVEVYVDGGVRRGTDVVKALALGAKAVFVGRPVLWALAYNGEEGVREMLEILRQELDRTLALIGCASIDQLRPEMVVHQDDFSQP